MLIFNVIVSYDIIAYIRFEIVSICGFSIYENKVKENKLYKNVFYIPEVSKKGGEGVRG